MHAVSLGYMLNCSFTTYADIGIEAARLKYFSSWGAWEGFFEKTEAYLCCAYTMSVMLQFDHCCNDKRC